jgi:GT2 family glycosyltransferase
MRQMSVTWDSTPDVVVVSYWSSAQLRGLLAGLPTQWPVTVVDNAEAGADAETRRVCNGRADHIPLGSNRGFGHAANVGARRGNAAYILFVNPDCRVDESVVRSLLSVLADQPGAAGCGPMLVADESGRRQIYGGALPRLSSALAYLVLPDRLLGRRCIWATTTRSHRPVDVGWLSGACLVLRRDAFEAVNGFREDLFMYNEDIDLCARLRRAGYAVVLDPRVSARHAGARSSAATVDVAALWCRSTLRYIGFAGRSRRPVLLAVVLLGGMYRRHLVALLDGRSGATFAPQFAVQMLTILGWRRPG